MSRTKSVILWVVAIILMLTVSIYQRMTGPTHPKDGRVKIGNETIRFSLPRSHDITGDETVQIEVPDKRITGEISLRRYKSFDTIQTKPMTRKGDMLSANIPVQPAAGKVEYKINLIYYDGTKTPLTVEPVIIRFKGHVPLYILIPHIFCMFFSMVFSIRAALEVIFKGNKALWQSVVTLLLLICGGAILGPIVQKFAFDAYWTGWPFGHDLTDNKTLVSLIFWIIAVYRLKKNPNSRWIVLIAAIVMLGVYLIPHSVLGSEIDYTKMPQQ